jgi:hypothetical protein
MMIKKLLEARALMVTVMELPMGAGALMVTVMELLMGAGVPMV